VILVTRLHGAALALNSDLLERAEAMPHTVLTLVDGTQYVVQESVEEVIGRVRDFRASIVAQAQYLESYDAAPSLRVVHDPECD
jgi:flagellar protein FlbD